MEERERPPQALQALFSYFSCQAWTPGKLAPELVGCPSWHVPKHPNSSLGHLLISPWTVNALSLFINTFLAPKNCVSLILLFSFLPVDIPKLLGRKGHQFFKVPQNIFKLSLTFGVQLCHFFMKSHLVPQQLPQINQALKTQSFKLPSVPKEAPPRKESMKKKEREGFGDVKPPHLSIKCKRQENITNKKKDSVRWVPSIYKRSRAWETNKEPQEKEPSNSQTRQATTLSLKQNKAAKAKQQ